MSITAAIMRCADLTRDFPEMRSKRVAFEQKRGAIQIAATDGHVAARYTLTGPAITPGGNYTALGADFPQWRKHQWEIKCAPDRQGIRCDAFTAKGARSEASAKRDRVVDAEPGRGVALDFWSNSVIGARVSVGQVDEFHEIRDALAVLHGDTDVSLVTGRDGKLSVVAGPMVAATGLALDMRCPMLFSVEILDRALDLLEDFDAGGLIWDFPANPLDPVIIRSQDARAEVLAMPMRR